jgi:predicted MFS family arabinose efflux permease
MNDAIISTADTQPAEKARWGAVISLTLCVTGLVTAELLPVSLLTPMAAGLGVTEGMAGQAVTATAIVALFASLLMAAATRRLDRRVVLLSFTLLSVVSNVLVGAASSYVMLLAARMLLGVGLGGFWSMAVASTMRLVPGALVPRALAVLFGGVSVAMAVSAPLGTYLGSIFGWRGVYFATAALGVVTLIWQLRTLPAMAPSGQARLNTLLRLARRPQVSIGMLGMVLVFGGHFVFFTYLRLFLESVTAVDVRTVSLIQFGFGAANVIGTFVSGALIQRSLRSTLAFMPLLMAVVALGLMATGTQALLAAVLVTAWGFAFGTVPVSWSTWLTLAVPDETESGGGLQVAAIQLAITAGAALGGALVDASGASAAMLGGGAILLAATAVIRFGVHAEGSSR